MEMVQKPDQHQRNKQTNRIRFMLEGSWPCTSFVLCSLNESHNRIASIGQLYERTWSPFVCCQAWCRVNLQNTQQKYTSKNFIEFHSHFLCNLYFPSFLLICSNFNLFFRRLTGSFLEIIRLILYQRPTLTLTRRHCYWRS